MSGIWPPDVGGPASHAPELAAFLRGRGHEVEVAITADAEPAPEAYPVRGNAGYLQQAIINLIIHSETVMKGSNGTVTVALIVDEQGPAVCVSDQRVRTETEVAAAFEPFDPERQAADVSGLALFAARAIAEAHGGTLALDRKVAGTSFVMRLPRGN